MSSFKSTPLYGGAITVNLPTGFGDARSGPSLPTPATHRLTTPSTIRQIPDHQEVYLDSDGYTSIVFEILEYVDKKTDDEALQYHFQDLVDGTGDSTNVLEQSSAEMPKTPYVLSPFSARRVQLPRRSSTIMSLGISRALSSPLAPFPSSTVTYSY
jgi:hypothetical protein